MPDNHSRIPGFYRLSLRERILRIAKLRGVDPRELGAVVNSGGLAVETADLMIENALGVLGLPFGVALNFRINGRPYIVPMALEEPSVVAAASHAAKRILAGGGFTAESTEPLMVAQVQLDEVDEPAAVAERIERAEPELLALANEQLPNMVARGGGARAIEVRDLGDGMMAVHVLVDCQNAMGANLLNAVAEGIGDRIAAIADANLGIRILSNYSDARRTTAEAQVPVSALADDLADGLRVARGIAQASLVAERDHYRAVTHNKGVMNGVDGLVLATGNDWRAVEAAAHAYAARDGRYRPLATWSLDETAGVLAGRLELPLALGIVGGALRAHEGAQLALQLVGVRSATQLAEVAACAGLATNLAALRALVTEGIQHCHMQLHRRASVLKRRGAA
jgi:hydroxymethylglutaryl-CoA reductase